MNKSLQVLLALSLMFFSFMGSSFGQDSGSDPNDQDIKGGTVKYEQFTIFDLTGIGKDDPKIQEWLSTLPKGQKMAKVLYFNQMISLYEPDVKEIVPSREVQELLDKLPYIQPPKPEIKRILTDLNKNRKTRQVEFMTRLFLMENEIESQAWKPGNKQRIIQGYICVDASMKRGEETITAWFTPNIPIPLGPDNFRGLPGLILAVDINGENVILATLIDLTAPPDNRVSIPKRGRNIKQETLDQIVTEKAIEFEQSQKGKSLAKDVDKNY